MIIPVKSMVMLLTELHSKSEILNKFPVQITLSNSEELFWLSKSTVGVKKKQRLLTIKNVPKYLTVNFGAGNEFRFKKYSSIKGYALCLDNYSDINEYMQDQFNSKARNRIKKRIRRLEKSFNITYNIYFGEIDEDKCSILLDLLKEMIYKRFQERNQESDALKNWAWLQKNVHSLILAKKASLYVIYHEEKPLSISFGYHYGSIFFSYITSYDIDYYKFGLGNIMVYKKLEVCLKNKYRFLEMGWGDLEYKRRWCNHINNLEHYVLFPKYSLLARFIAFWEGNKTRLKAYILSSKLNTLINKTKIFFSRSKKYVRHSNRYFFENLENMNSFTNLIPIDLKNKENLHFKPVLNDFIYKTEEYYLDVKLYKSPNEEFYVIKGKNFCKKVVFGA